MMSVCVYVCVVSQCWWRWARAVHERTVLCLQRPHCRPARRILVQGNSYVHTV